MWSHCSCGSACTDQDNAYSNACHDRTITGSHYPPLLEGDRHFNDIGDFVVATRADVTVTVATFPDVPVLGQSRWQPLPRRLRLCRQQRCAEKLAARDALRRSLNAQRQRIRRLDEAYRVAKKVRNAQSQRRLRDNAEYRTRELYRNRLRRRQKTALQRHGPQYGSIQELAWLRDCFSEEEWSSLETLWPTPTLGFGRRRTMGVALQVGGVPHGHSHGAHHAGDDDDAHLKDGVTVIENGGSSPHSRTARGSGNINVRAALIHIIGDFLQNLGAFVAALIFFRPEYRIADPLCTFLFSVLVLLSTITILREALTVLMEGKPSSIDFRQVLRLLAQQPGVHMVHNLRIWALPMDKIALSAHIVIRPNEDAMQVLKSCSRMIRSNYDLFELTLQIEEYHEVMDDCTKCNDLRS